MSEYIISEKALEDINNIWIYTAENWSVEQANRYYNLIIDEIEYIVDNFDMARELVKNKK
jgi:toxin ParE1/3/4